MTYHKTLLHRVVFCFAAMLSKKFLIRTGKIFIQSVMSMHQILRFNRSGSIIWTNSVAYIVVDIKSFIPKVLFIPSQVIHPNPPETLSFVRSQNCIQPKPLPVSYGPRYKSCRNTPAEQDLNTLGAWACFRQQPSGTRSLAIMRRRRGRQTRRIHLGNSITHIFFPYIRNTFYLKFTYQLLNE